MSLSALSADVGAVGCVITLSYGEDHRGTERTRDSFRSQNQEVVQLSLNPGCWVAMVQAAFCFSTERPGNLQWECGGQVYLPGLVAVCFVVVVLFR